MNNNEISLTVDFLASQTEEVFRLLSELGFKLEKRELLWPESFKGGFILTYSGHSVLIIQYLDCELEIIMDGQVLFGSDYHPGFVGNMFSRSHLSENLSKIADDILKAISQQGRT